MGCYHSSVIRRLSPDTRMKRLVQLLAVAPVIVCSLIAVAQAPSASPSHAKEQPSGIDVVRTSFQYEKTISSLRAIDFRNVEYRFFVEDDATGEIRPEFTARLHNGKFHRDERSNGVYTGSDDIGFDWVQFITGPQQYAVVSLWWTSVGGSSSPSEVIEVFGFEHQHPTVVQEIMFNVRGCSAARATFNAANNTLRVVAVHGWEHCCPKTLDVVTYKWSGSSFSQMTAKTAPMAQACS